MPIEAGPDCIVLNGAVTVEDAEQLLAQLLAHPGLPLAMENLEHIHAAALQVVLAAGRAVQSWPQDALLAGWLAAALPTQAI